MRLKSIELAGFKSFAKKTTLEFDADVTAIVGPNGSGKSNVAEAFRFVLGEQSMKSMRGRRGEDLIWNGSTHSPRANRASVRLILDNTDRALSLDFDEVAFERVVNRDGTNDYILNGSQVRLRDIAELLAQANIGASGHHIISQGEADRILSASPADRREMIEDALGLTAYLYKREEAERKLQKTAENMREVEALRRELSPHLKFLSRQVEKIKEGEELRRELTSSYLDYLRREAAYLEVAGAEVRTKGQGPAEEKKTIDARIAHLRAEVESKGTEGGSGRELLSLEQESRAASGRREELTRELGRIEGELAARARFSGEEGTVPASEAVGFANDLAVALERALERDLSGIREVAMALARRARDFAARFSSTSRRADSGGDSSPERKATLERELAEAKRNESRIAEAMEALRRGIDAKKDASRAAERALFTAMTRRGELEAILSALAARLEQVEQGRELFKRELGEAGALIGRAALDYEHYSVVENGREVTPNAMAAEPRGRQEERRRRVERLKIKLEEASTGNASETLKEYHETTERDTFLSRELDDLTHSAESLRGLIADLTDTLEERFSAGIEAISVEFETFFKLLFGAGTARLELIAEARPRRKAEDEEEGELEEEEAEEGVEISVSLPHKRLKGLHALSGGERALTSIALIFAMSQVNPPPFLILDETDAALDEANSRRYGDMLETLARRSQLIVITHNRETMSRAGILYGVTMGQDGVSKLLSVRFEEAVAVAK